MQNADGCDTKELLQNRCCQKLQSKRYFCLIYLISFGSLGIVSVIVLYRMVHSSTAIYRKVCDVSMQSLQGLDKQNCHNKTDVVTSEFVGIL